MLCRDISLPVRRLSFGCSRCLLPLLAGTGGAVRGGEVGEWGVGLAVCACVLWGKGAGDGETLGRGWSEFICYLCGIVIYQLQEDTHQ